MRMDEMNKMFEEQGFEVKRKWNHVTDCYEFTIRKDNNFLRTAYKYPVDIEKVKANTDQREFVERTIKEFERDFGPRRRIISYALQKSFMAVLTDWCHRHRIIVNTELNAEDDKANLHFFKDGKEEHITIYWPEIISIGDVLAGIHERLTELGMAPDKYHTYTRRNDSMSALAEATYYMTQYDHPLTKAKILFKNGKYIKTIGENKLETSIKDVIFNPPATIVMWDDGTKTVVKAQGGDEFDAEKGLAMAISKKALGNDRKYYHTFIHWLKRFKKPSNDMVYEIKLPNIRACSEQFKAFRKAWLNNDIEKAKAAEKKRKAVEMAYKLLVAYRDGVDPNNEQLNPDREVDLDLDEVIGYLGEALEG